MKVLVVGGTGTIGKAVVDELKSDHEVIIAGFEHGDVRVNIESLESIEKMYQSVNKLDAVIATTGRTAFAPLAQLTPEQFQLGLTSKLMGQIHLVMAGLKYLNSDGSFTLTSGILNHQPIATGSAAALVNGGIDGFVKAAAMEMPNGLRINAVSPTVLTESLPVYGDYFKGFESVDAKKVALAYRKSVDNLFTGKVFHVGYCGSCC